MCGRYTLTVDRETLEERFDARFDPGDDYAPRYNCAPGQDLPVVAGDDPGAFRRMEWGLVPTWADEKSDGGFINARAETVREKRSFADPFERRRCLVPADGFYEWAETDEGDKRPYRVTLDDGGPFAMAGLWERWKPPKRQTGLGEYGGGSGEESGDGDGTGAADLLETFTVVTTDPNDVVDDLHHRMAVVLAPDEESTWLDGDPDEAAALLDPYPDDTMRAYPVSTAVNSPANDRPDLVEEAEG